MPTKMILPLLLALVTLAACGTDDDFPTGGTDDPNNTSTPMLKVRFRFAEDQQRLDNLGTPTAIPTGHAAQTPDFHQLSVHFIELVPNATTPYQKGTQLYQGPTIAANNPNPFGFTDAIDFNNAKRAGTDEFFLEVPIANLDFGRYEHIRVSVGYQNYSIRYNLNEVPVVGELRQKTGTIASFLGYNTYLENVQVNQKSVAVNDFKLQGFWAFETQLPPPYDSYDQVTTGQAPENATTVVNPFPDAPIPPGSCVISGSFNKPLKLTGEIEEDIEIILSFSTNNSFEWIDTDGNGEWDIDVSNPENTEQVVDMGLRGLQAIHGQ